MGKKLSQMTWAEVQKEMSIAGSPEKIAELGRDIWEIMGKGIDSKNRAELTNAEFMLQRLLAEIRLAQRRWDKSHTINTK
jgi:hypothetical protein